MSEQSTPRYRRPAFPGEAHFDSLEGDGDPATRSEAADRCATLLVRGAHDPDDEQIVERVIRLADNEGLDTIADLWAGAPPDSLAGCLWRLYLLRSWVYADPVGVLAPVPARPAGGHDAGEGGSAEEHVGEVAARDAAQHLVDHRP